MSSGPIFEKNARLVYNLADPVQQTYERLTLGTTLVQDDFALASTSEMQRATDAFDTTTRTLTADLPTFVQTSNTLTLLNEGDDTAFDETFMTRTPVDIIIDKILFNFGIGLNVSAYTAGNFAIDAVTITITAFKAQGQTAWSTILTAPFTLANMTAVDNQIAIVDLMYNTPFPLYQGGILQIQIAVTETTGTGTRQVGMLTAFPFQAAATTKELSPSGFMIYYHNNVSLANTLTTGGYAQFAGQENVQTGGQAYPVAAGEFGGINA